MYFHYLLLKKSVKLVNDLRIKNKNDAKGLSKDLYSVVQGVSQQEVF